MPSESAIVRLADEPAVQRLAAMPGELLELLEKTDPLRAQIVKDCIEFVNM